MGAKKTAWFGTINEVTSDHCWACEEPFSEEDEVRGVDLRLPKVVHDREPCVNALSKLKNDPRWGRTEDGWERVEVAYG